MDVCQAEVTAGVAVGELLVIKSELVEDGGMEVMEMGSLLHGRNPIFIGRSKPEPTLDSSPCHPEGKPLMVVVPAVLFLHVRGATEFSSPDDEGFLQHATFLQVLKEGGDGLVNAGAVLNEILAQTVVLVPVAVSQLYEADPGLCKAASEKALTTKVIGLRISDSVELLDLVRFS